jgi:glycosyltransferase involved in cell wall biosynthesis
MSIPRNRIAVFERSARRPQTELPAVRAHAVEVAVLIPCYNEEAAIGRVVTDFRAALPDARIYVYDNNSRDRTALIGAAAGAAVRSEPMQGKGNVVRRMFADIEAEVYVLADGDGTYDAGDAPRLIAHLVEHRLDMVNGLRIGEHTRRGHRFGNDVFNRIVGWVFGARFADMLSGYKVFSRRFVKSFPALASGFEVETELTVHALRLRMPVAELPTRYGRRADGSASKLRTVRDGIKILGSIVLFVKEERPLAFFSAISGLFCAVSLALAAPLFVTFVETGLVPRLPTAVLAVGLMVLAALGLSCGLVLDTVTRGRVEMKRLHYLGFPAPGEKMFQ